MSSGKDWTIRIRHILESIARIKTYTDGMTEESFSADTKTVDAVVRNIEINWRGRSPRALERTESS
jgi:uncharacterized protein with HEPN domain